MVWAPKEVKHDHVRSASGVRFSAELRPIGVRNTALRLISTVISRQLMHVAQSSVAWCQRGFISGRVFLQNLVDIDAISRVWCMQENAEAASPCLALMDQRNAFGRVEHGWITSVLRFIGCPDYLIDFISDMFF